MDENVFARLDHYHDHELTTKVAQSNRGRGGTATGVRRRGRPMKHPAVPNQQMAPVTPPNPILSGEM